MTRKRYVKLMMASGWDRNTANDIGIDPSKCHPCVPQERKLIAWAYRGSFPLRHTSMLGKIIRPLQPWKEDMLVCRR